MTQQTKRVEAYTFVEFCKELQSAIQEGYAIDFNDNASIPSGGIGYYKAVLYKGPKIAALLKAPADKESFEQDLDQAAKAMSELDKAIELAESKPFTPSVVFEAREVSGKPAATKGRPKKVQV